MATLDRLLREVGKAFGRKRIWLTEYGYQTNPPDRLLGVSQSLQARYLAEAAQRAYATPYVDMLIQYLYQDEPDAGRWQSGLLTAAGRPKASRVAAILPLAQASRTGLRTVLWGQIRPGHGRRRYTLQQYRNGRTCHPLLPFYDWDGCRPALGRVGNVLIAGCRDHAAARQLGFVPTHGLGAALTMVRGWSERPPRVGFLLSPPYFPLRVVS